MTSKQFEPTSRKLKKAKQKGDVGKSRDFTMLGPSLTLTVSLLFSEQLLEWFAVILIASFQEELPPLIIVTLSFLPALFFLIIVAVSALFFELFQVGFSLNMKLLVPDFSRLTPSLRKFKGVPIRILKYLLNIICCTFSCLILFLVESFYDLFIVVGVYLVWAIPLAFFDLFAVKSAHKRRLRMDSCEMRREFKEAECSPEVKQARKDNHLELINNSVSGSVRMSKVVLISD